MLERLRLQEVEEIIFSVPKGAVIPGLNMEEGEPLMIIEKPGISNLSFALSAKNNRDKGFISASEVTKSLDFTINDGSVLYTMWSYIYGTLSKNTDAILRGAEYVYCHDRTITLTTQPINLILYKTLDGTLEKMQFGRDYIIDNNIITLAKEADAAQFYACYSYKIANACVTTVKQIHNNIFCALDIYMNANDIITDEQYKVCIHCDRVQIFTDFELSVNHSLNTSFTPIEVHSIATEGNLNKTVATITVIPNE